MQAMKAWVALTEQNDSINIISYSKSREQHEQMDLMEQYVYTGFFSVKWEVNIKVWTRDLKGEHKNKVWR